MGSLHRPKPQPPKRHVLHQTIKFVGDRSVLFPAIVTPLAMQQYMLLQRNLVYTGITRGKKLVVLIDQRKGAGAGGEKQPD
jgi:hypothetical protein